MAREYSRETNTMPQWAGSCWYYLRFCDPRNSRQAWDPEKEKYWMPVDLYVGGAEHAVLHLLYSRFWHKVLFDRGHVSTMEPFQRLVNQGMILSITYRTSEGRIVPYTQIRFEEGKALHAETGEELAGVTEKMSKSRGQRDTGGCADSAVWRRHDPSLRNVHGPARNHEALEHAGSGRDQPFPQPRLAHDRRGVRGCPAAQLQESRRKMQTPNEDQLRVLHKTIRAVTQDMETLSFNTAISRLMEFVNYFTGQESRPHACMESFVLMLAPMAPHICEELWQVLGHSESLAYAPWPAFSMSGTCRRTRSRSRFRSTERSGARITASVERNRTRSSSRLRWRIPREKNPGGRHDSKSDRRSRETHQYRGKPGKGICMKPASGQNSSYTPLLDLRQTERAIRVIKEFFQINLAESLNLLRVSAPLFVLGGTGINDDLNGIEKPISFAVKSIRDGRAEIVQSLAKWKRMALADYGFKPGEGLYTDMNAIRPDEVLDDIHSVYVDQWDWERVMRDDERNLAFLRGMVERIYGVILRTEQHVCEKFPQIKPFLPLRKSSSCTAKNWQRRWPELDASRTGKRNLPGSEGSLHHRHRLAAGRRQAA